MKKDLATTIGLPLALIIVVVANLLEGGNPSSLILLPPMLLVFGCTLAVTFAGGTIQDGKNALKSIKRAFGGSVQPPLELVPTLVSLADSARREGLLALERRVDEIEDPFLVKGITLAVDGTDPEEVREILESEVFAKRSADKTAAKFWGDAGAYSPTIGIIGTVMSLVHVMENLGAPDELGHSIAAAFLATLWGVTSANTMFLPLAARLKRLSELECTCMEMVVEGVAAIQAGSNPRVVAQKLRSLVNEDDTAEAAA